MTVAVNGLSYPATLVTATGDDLQGTSAGVLERLAVGSNGQRQVPIAGKKAWRTPVGAATGFSAPASTTSLVGVMAGLAGSFTPNSSGTVLLIMQGLGYNNTLLDGFIVQLRTGTGTAPVNGAALTGTAQGSAMSAISSTANAYVPFCVVAVVSGLTIATAYWVDLAQTAIAAGTVQLNALNLAVVEL